jgi:hypothetical protein
MLEDERLVGWAPVMADTEGSGPRLAAPGEAVTAVVQTLLLFTAGLGERTVSITLDGRHRAEEPHPRWYLMEARTLEPPPPPREVADFHREYRQLHEAILFEFQEQSRETAVLAATISLEQVAYSVVGGLLLKGVGVIIGKAAPTVVSVLSQGGSAAVRWFRNLLVRAPRQDVETRRSSSGDGHVRNTSSYTTPSSPGFWDRKVCSSMKCTTVTRCSTPTCSRSSTSPEKSTSQACTIKFIAASAPSGRRLGGLQVV